jgi:hypothetical protein
MKSAEYRKSIRIISTKLIKQHFPGLKLLALQNCAIEIAKNVHARMYGANVDGVASPIWRNENDAEPNVDASELLKQE